MGQQPFKESHIKHMFYTVLKQRFLQVRCELALLSLSLLQALTPPMQLYPPNAAPVLPTILTTPFGTAEEMNAAAQQAASGEPTTNCHTNTYYSHVFVSAVMPILNTIPNLPEPAPKVADSAASSTTGICTTSLPPSSSLFHLLFTTT